MSHLRGGRCLHEDRSVRVHTIVNFLIEDGLVTGMCVVRNPDKLGRLEQPVSLAR